MNKSMLGILQKEDALIKERELNFDRRVHMMHTYDDIQTYRVASKAKDEELARLMTEIDTSKKRETDIDLEILEVRKQIRRYAARILEG